MHPSKVKVLVADDHAVVLRGLVDILRSNSHIEVIGEAVDGRDAIEQYLKHRPDVLLLDLTMPDMAGVEVIERIRAADPNALILIATAVDGEDDTYLGLRAGAAGVILKDAPEQEIIDAVLAPARDSRQTVGRLPEEISGRNGQQLLSGRETEILHLLAAGLNDDAIAGQVGVAKRQVRFHVRNILAKLGCDSRTGAIDAARRRGLIRVD